MKHAAYSEAEIARHRTVSDLWVSSRGKVYDVTKFIDRHPGGMEVLLTRGGSDVTEVMRSADVHKHSKAAYAMMDQYCIGECKDYEDHQEAWDNNNEQSGNERLETDQLSRDLGIRRESVQELHAELDPSIIDITKPMVWQIGKLGKHYQKWIHTPDDVDLRFFETDWIESLTMCQWYVIPTVWLPIMLYFLYLSASEFFESGPEVMMPFLFGGITLSTWHMPILFIGGVLMWTLLEYVIHRWVFHLRPPHWSKLLITLHFLFHGQHHKNPMNKDRLVFPPVPAAFFAFFIYHAYCSLLPRASSWCIIAGTVLGYIYYDLMHYYLHHGSPSLPYLKDLKNYHINHHYVEQQKGFGISSKLWDYPFSTLSSPTNRNTEKSR